MDVPAECSGGTEKGHNLLPRDPNQSGLIATPLRGSALRALLVLSTSSAIGANRLYARSR